MSQSSLCCTFGPVQGVVVTGLLKKEDMEKMKSRVTINHTSLHTNMTGITLNIKCKVVAVSHKYVVLIFLYGAWLLHIY